MSKRVIMIASGETERRALPLLVRHLRDQDVVAEDVRIPPRNRALDVEMAARLIKAAWYENLGAPPDKFVVVVDVDRAEPAEALESMRTQLPARVPGIGADVLYAYAQAHLEAWYFADVENLRERIGRAPGNVDTSKPDEIDNPKLHLQHVLAERVYTARVSAEIAGALEAATIARRSPSFRTFVEAVRNGSGDHLQRRNTMLRGVPRSRMGRPVRVRNGSGDDRLQPGGVKLTAVGGGPPGPGS